MSASVVVLSVPCCNHISHAPHPFDVVTPGTPTLVWTLSCPGWTPTPSVKGKK